jgi:hypothetical protein
MGSGDRWMWWIELTTVDETDDEKQAKGCGE